MSHIAEGSSSLQFFFIKVKLNGNALAVGYNHGGNSRVLGCMGCLG